MESAKGKKCPKAMVPSTVSLWHKRAGVVVRSEVWGSLNSNPGGQSGLRRLTLCWGRSDGSYHWHWTGAAQRSWLVLLFKLNSPEIHVSSSDLILIEEIKADLQFFNWQVLCCVSIVGSLKHSCLSLLYYIYDFYLSLSTGADLIFSNLFFPEWQKIKDQRPVCST